LLVNPIYAIEIHVSFCRPHEHFLTESQWVASNVRAIEELGATKWVKHLISALQVDHGHGLEPEDRLAVADPYPAITVHRSLCVEHPPLIEEEVWVEANARGLDQEGEEPWLRNLLSVLKGAYVT
jgi:hypothetical protein